MAVQYSLTYVQRTTIFTASTDERVGIGRTEGGVEPTLWPVDISALLANSNTPTTSTVRPRGFNREQAAATFTIQAVDGSADLDKLQRIAQKSINDVKPGELQLYADDATVPWRISGYIIGFAPQEFAWKRGSVAMECTFLPTSPWYRHRGIMSNGMTFTLPAANLPSGFFALLNVSSSFDFTITSDNGFSNRYRSNRGGVLDPCGLFLPSRASAALYAARPSGNTPKGGGAYLFEELPPDNTATYTVTATHSEFINRNGIVYEARTAPTWEV